jgi:hypothetical protein
MRKPSRIGNMKSTHVIRWALAVISGAALSLQVHAATVTATLDPKEISLGDTAQLTVTVSGAQDQPTTPSVDGLDITPVGQSTQIEIINGSMTANSSSTFAVTPRHSGTFTIPAIRAGAVASQPITLRVLAGSGGMAASPAPNAPSSSGPVVLPPPALTAPSAPDATPAPEGRFGSIQITLPKKEFYVGELVPVEIKALIPDDLQANVSDLPQFTSDGFTLNALGAKPEQTNQVINGRSYTVLSWHSALTAIKSGEFPFSLQMPLTVVMPQQMPQADDDDSFDNFFKNAFAAFGTKKNVTIRSAEQTLKILPLPQADRPADFGGAVGQFEVEASATPTRVSVGDPITLRLKISGHGNFDRVSTDMLSGDAQWKTYSPKSHFEPADSVGYQGEKTFEQPIIPNDASASTIPGVSFSFFDPEKRQYATRTTAPLAVTISGSPLTPATAVASTSANTQSAPPPAPASPSASDLAPNKVDPGAFVASLRPIYLNPLFLAGQAVPLVALLGGLLFLRRREHASHPDRVLAAVMDKAVRQQIQAMDEAMRKNQTDAFFIHARTAFQMRLGPQLHLRPEAVTLADVEARLGDPGATIRPVFEMADQARYSDLHFEASDLQQWRQAIVNELSEKN